MKDFASKKTPDKTTSLRRILIGGAILFLIGLGVAHYARRFEDSPEQTGLTKTEPQEEANSTSNAIEHQTTPPQPKAIKTRYDFYTELPKTDETR